MASGGPAERLREEARCAVCLDFLQEPVSVLCGHSFCRRCISEFCARTAGARDGLFACPQCRCPFAPDSFRPNRQLASLVDSVRRLALGAGPAGARLCARHGEELSGFCEDDGTALCWVCDSGPEHRGHRMAPLQEAARGYQAKLQMALELMRKEMEEVLSQETHVGKKTVIWKEKVEAQRQRFRLEFEKSRGFLAGEERLQLRRLEEEERATLHRLQEGRARLAQQGRALKELAEELEERCQRPAAALLEGVREVLRRSKDVLHLDLETVPMELKTMCRIPGMREMLRKFQGAVEMDGAHERAQGGFILLGFCGHPHLERILFVVILIAYLLTFMGNTTTVLVSRLDPQIHTPMYFFFSHLSFLGLSFTSSSNPQPALQPECTRQDHQLPGLRPSALPLPSLGGEECLLLAVMAHDHSAAVCKPPHYTEIMNPRLSPGLVSVACGCGIASSLAMSPATLAHPTAAATVWTASSVRCLPRSGWPVPTQLPSRAPSLSWQQALCCPHGVHPGLPWPHREGCVRNSAFLGEAQSLQHLWLSSHRGLSFLWEYHLHVHAARKELLPGPGQVPYPLLQHSHLTPEPLTYTL